MVFTNLEARAANNVQIRRAWVWQQADCWIDKAGPATVAKTVGFQKAKGMLNIGIL